MSICSLKHSIDRYFGPETDFKSLNETLQHYGFSSNAYEESVIQNGIDVNQVKNELFFFGGRNNDVKSTLFLDDAIGSVEDRVNFIETFQNYKWLIREKPVSQDQHLYYNLLSQKAFQSYNLQLVDKLYKVNLEEDVDVIYTILYMYANASIDNISREQQKFLERIIKIKTDFLDKSTNPNVKNLLGDEKFKKLMFELKLQDFKSTNQKLFTDVKTIDNIEFFESAILKQKYPEAYTFYSMRRQINSEPFKWLFYLKSINNDNKVLNAIAKNDYEKMRNLVDNNNFFYFSQKDLDDILKNFSSDKELSTIDYYILDLIYENFKSKFDGNQVKGFESIKDWMIEKLIEKNKANFFRFKSNTLSLAENERVVNKYILDYLNVDPNALSNPILTEKQILEFTYGFLEDIIKSPDSVSKKIDLNIIDDIVKDLNQVAIDAKGEPITILEYISQGLRGKGVVLPTEAYFNFINNIDKNKNILQKLINLDEKHLQAVMMRLSKKEQESISKITQIFVELKKVDEFKFSGATFDSPETVIEVLQNMTGLSYKDLPEELKRNLLIWNIRENAIYSKKTIMNVPMYYFLTKDVDFMKANFNTYFSLAPIGEKFDKGLFKRLTIEGVISQADDQIPKVYVKKLAKQFGFQESLFDTQELWRTYEYKQVILNELIRIGQSISDADIVAKFRLIAEPSEYIQIFDLLRQSELYDGGLFITFSLDSIKKTVLEQVGGLITQTANTNEKVNTVVQLFKNIDNRLELINKSFVPTKGIYTSTGYTSMVRNFISYTTPELVEKLNIQETLLTIAENFYKNDELDSLLEFMQTENPKLYNYFIQRSKVTRHALSSKNRTLFNNQINTLTANLTEKFNQANTLRDKLAIAAIANQFGLNGMIKSQLELYKSLKDVVLISGAIYPNKYIRLFVQNESFLESFHQSYLFFSTIDNYFSKNFKKFANFHTKTRYLKNLIGNLKYTKILKSSQIYEIPLDNEIISSQDYVALLTDLKSENEITLDDMVDLMFVHYKQSDVQLDQSLYVDNLLVDLELYSPSIYNLILPSLSYYKNYFNQRFADILLILRVIDPTTRGQYLESLKQNYQITFENYIDFNVPYDLMISRIGTLTQNSWEAYLDIEPLMEYQNFSMQNYFNQLFQNVNIKLIHKILVILKGIYISDYRNDFRDYIINNKRVITKTDASNNLIPNTVQNSFVPYNLLNPIVVKDASLNFMTNLYEQVSIEIGSDDLYYDAVFYHYLNTSYRTNNVGQGSTGAGATGQGSTGAGATSSSYFATIDLKFTSDFIAISEDIGLSFVENSINRLFVNPSYLQIYFNRNPSKFNNQFDNITSNIIHFDDSDIVTLKDQDIDDLIDGIFNSTDNEIFLQKLESNKEKFMSLNLDMNIVMEKAISKLNKQKLFIFINYLYAVPYRQDLETFFTKSVIQFIYYKKYDVQIYNDLYTLYSTSQKIDIFGLYYILGSLSLFENNRIEFESSNNPLDRINSFNIDVDSLLTQMRAKLSGYNLSLFNILPPSNNQWKRVLYQNRYFNVLLGYDQDEIAEGYENYVQTNKQKITENNYEAFINIFLNSNIQNPIELIKLLDNYYFENDNVIEYILTELKSLNKLSKFFYKNWIDSLRLPSGIGYISYVPTMIRKIVDADFLTEEDVFEIMDILDDPVSFMNQFSYEYTFKKDIKDFKFYKKLSDKEIEDSGFIKSSGATVSTNPSNQFNNIRTDNLSELFTQILENRKEMEAIIETNKIVSGSTNKVDVTAIYQEVFSQINQESDNAQNNTDPDILSDETLQELLSKKKFADIGAKYLNYGETKSIQEGLMAAQILISLSDPAQVLTDALQDDLINNGIIPSIAKDYDVKVEQNTFPSFFMAYVMVNTLIQNYFQRHPEIKTVWLPYSIDEQLSELSDDALKEILNDYTDMMQNIQRRFEKERLIKESYIKTLMYTTFIHNKNAIKFNPEMDVSLASKYRINMEQGKAAITAVKGGDGMIIIEKN